MSMPPSAMVPEPIGVYIVVGGGWSRTEGHQRTNMAVKGLGQVDKQYDGVYGRTGSPSGGLCRLSNRTITNEQDPNCALVSSMLGGTRRSSTRWSRVRSRS